MYLHINVAIGIVLRVDWIEILVHLIIKLMKNDYKSGRCYHYVVK